MKPFALFAWIAVALLFAYGVYMFWQAGKVPATINLSSAANFKSLPATVCTLSNDANTISGTLYVFHDAARFDITSTTNGAPVNTNIIVTREDSAFIWQGGQTVGAKYDYGALYNSLQLELITQVSCTLWWIPAGDLFVVPQDVTIPK